MTQNLKSISVHERALITWLAIFPLVSADAWLISPLTQNWPLLYRTALLTLLVVPMAVYLVIPLLLKGYMRLRFGEFWPPKRAK